MPKYYLHCFLLLLILIILLNIPYPCKRNPPKFRAFFALPLRALVSVLCSRVFIFVFCLIVFCLPVIHSLCAGVCLLLLASILVFYFVKFNCLFVCLRVCVFTFCSVSPNGLPIKKRSKFVLLHVCFVLFVSFVCFCFVCFSFCLFLFIFGGFYSFLTHPTKKSSTLCAKEFLAPYS